MVGALALARHSNWFGVAVFSGVGVGGWEKVVGERAEPNPSESINGQGARVRGDSGAWPSPIKHCYPGLPKAFLPAVATSLLQKTPNNASNTSPPSGIPVRTRKKKKKEETI